MTSFQSPAVHSCPGCNAFFLRRRVSTINFLDAQDWSDGMPTVWWKQEPLVRCGACAALFWLDDTKCIGIMPERPRPIGRLARAWMRWCGDPQGRLRHEDEWLQARALWGDALYIDSVNFNDVVYVLARSERVSRDRLLWLRKRIWWGLNDRYRHHADDSPSPNVATWTKPDEQANMQAILDMLKEGEMNSWDMLQQGELLRLLGRFDEAIAVLKAVPPDGHSEIRALKIERLARGGDALVRELSLPSW
jgi:hypothetical protein